MVKIKRVPKKASIWEIEGDILVSSEIHQMKGNLHMCKWSKIDMNHSGM